MPRKLSDLMLQIEQEAQEEGEEAVVELAVLHSHYKLGGAMRVIVCGSRKWSDRVAIVEVLADLPGDTTIVVGYNPKTDTPKGADRLAYQEAQDLGLMVESHPAQWDEHGKAAGLIRNVEMAQSGADLCIAFWDRVSKGTAHMMEEARKRDIPVQVVVKR